MQLHITKTGYLAHWHFYHMARQVVITCLVLLLYLSAKSQTTLVGWNFADSDSIADFFISTNNGRKITTNTHGAISFPAGSSDQSISSLKWDNGNNLKYWQISFSSQGYKSLSIFSKQRSSDKGPRDFKLQYSFDETVWVDAGMTILVENNFTSGVVNNFSLPSACNNQSIVFIRWLDNSDASVDGTTIDGRGTSRIDDIYIKGYLIPVLTSPLIYSCCSGSIVNYIPSGPGTVFDWNRPAVSGILESFHSGSGTINEVLTNTTQLPIEVGYNFNLEADGITNSQTVVVTVNPTPDLVVSPNTQISCPSGNIQPISFSNPSQLAGTTFFWEWTNINSEKLTIAPSTGTSSPINALVSSSSPSTLLETSIRVSAISPHGCSVNQVVNINVGDNQPPTFTSHLDTVSFCVQDIVEGTSNGTDDINEARPDFYRMIPGNHSLDLDPAIFADNCNASNDLTLYYQIDFYENPNSFVGSGQPSSALSAIVFSGSVDHVVNHRITYWLEDKWGNKTPSNQRAVVIIAVYPRPHIVQNF